MMPRKHKEGDRFGRLVITQPYSKKIGHQWGHEVLCDCGKIKCVAGSDMRKGTTLSCGCLHLEMKTKHGLCDKPEYKIWASMVQRCTNKKGAAYKNYGGRGICVSERWLTFLNFYKDMGERPSPHLTLERVDNNAGYNKGNCVWASRNEQSANQRIRNDNTTGIKGVSVDAGGRYFAHLQVNKKRYMATFNNLEDAIKHRKELEAKHKGNK
jgi:hypothetical protein